MFTSKHRIPHQNITCRASTNNLLHPRFKTNDSSSQNRSRVIQTRSLQPSQLFIQTPCVFVNSSSSLHSPILLHGPKSIRLGSFSCTTILHRHSPCARRRWCSSRRTVQFSSVTATDRVGCVFGSPFVRNPWGSS